jgi:hypothetical protein
MTEARTNGSHARTTTRSRIKERAEEAKHWLEGTGPRPARKLMNALPVSRQIPQDVHSVLDYIGAATCIASALFARKSSAKAAAIGIGATTTVASLLTDYRLSVAKVIPIEAHEVLDYVSGISQVSAPFMFGYWKKDRVTSLMNIANGAAVILVSMFTDYRAQKGIG